MKRREGESIKDFIKRLHAMLDRTKRDAEIIREWKGLPKEINSKPTRIGKKSTPGAKFHSPRREE